MVLFDRATISAALLDGGVFVYEGAVLDGDTVRQVRADVFIYCVQPGFADQPVAVVEFIEVGTLR